jgi:DNA modification methylase
MTKKLENLATSPYLTDLIDEGQTAPPVQEITRIEIASDAAAHAEAALEAIDVVNEQFERRYDRKLSREPLLTRGLVSFQANKGRAVYRWYKFKEAFSADLVEFLLGRYATESGTILDPFAGSGTALFASSDLGWHAEGIELLPIGQHIVQTKRLIESGLGPAELHALSTWIDKAPWSKPGPTKPVPELRITKGAYPEETAQSIGRFLADIEHENETVRSILFFALLCILEAISFTRKDGQYLRWDYRSGRRQGKKIFNKGHIPSFDEAMLAKLRDIVGDFSSGAPQPQLFPQTIQASGKTTLHRGSCLDLLPTFAASSYDCIITSPPYCNRYDYTRTYALELALLGVDEPGLTKFRQTMLSCTVENRAKDLLAMNPLWSTALAAAEGQEILRMVKGYFYEMACVISECARVLKPGAPLMMVNDNVRYAGANIPVDIILSEIAVAVGFTVEKILVLPTGKGNSSQQMGTHGREPARKCVYIWRRT